RGRAPITRTIAYFKLFRRFLPFGTVHNTHFSTINEIIGIVNINNNSFSITLNATGIRNAQSFFSRELRQRILDTHNNVLKGCVGIMAHDLVCQNCHMSITR
ncbi:hypothetical protein ACN38_g13230, partial [Penicillium nordicum]